MPRAIEFARREDAAKFRNDPRFQAFLADRDDGRETTLYVKDDTPENALEDIRGEAAESRQFERQQAGQVSLTDEERRRIDFSREGVNVPKVRSIKGIAENEGVDDWLAFADLDLTVDENRSVLQRAKREERGRRMDARSDESFAVDREARAFQREQREAFPHLVEGAFAGDDEAQAEVREAGLGELDIGFSRTDTGILRGSGRDFERVQDIHEDRSERAQRVDERRQNQDITRDPFKWAAAPDKHDFPGVDTVDPAELHSERPERAQELDEQERAPITESKEVWAQNMDRFDFQGVDTPAESASEPQGFAANPDAAAGVENPGREIEKARAADIGVSLAPEEFLDGVAAGSTREAGGLNTLFGGEVRPKDEVDFDLL